MGHVNYTETQRRHGVSVDLDKKSGNRNLFAAETRKGNLLLKPTIRILYMERGSGWRMGMTRPGDDRKRNFLRTIFFSLASLVQVKQFCPPPFYINFHTDIQVPAMVVIE